MKQGNRSLEEPCYLEMWLVILTGLLHVTVELVWGSGRSIQPAWPEQLYNVSAAVLWGCYLLWRGISTPSMVRRWGWRRDTFFLACRPCLLFVILAAGVMFIYAGRTDRLVIPRTFWVALLLYLFYGIAQQFALQALITRNLRGLVTGRPFRVLVVATLFSAVHFPDGRLMGLAFSAGVFFTWIYESYPNLWAVGIAHGMLGTLGYYLILGLDPGAEVLGLVAQFQFRVRTATP